MPIGGKGGTEPPNLFMVIMIFAGIVFFLGGLRRWPLLLESGRLPDLISRVFALSIEERNNYVAAFYIIFGLVLIATGLVLLSIFY